MREHVKGVIQIALIGIFALAGGIVSGSHIAYAYEIGVALTLVAVALGYPIYLHGIRSIARARM